MQTDTELQLCHDKEQTHPHTQNMAQVVPCSARQSKPTPTAAKHMPSPSCTSSHALNRPLLTRARRHKETGKQAKAHTSRVQMYFQLHTQTDKANLYKEKWKTFPFPHLAGTRMKESINMNSLHISTLSLSICVLWVSAVLWDDKVALQPIQIQHHSMFLL